MARRADGAGRGSIRLKILALVVGGLVLWDLGWWVAGVRPFFPRNLKRLRDSGEPPLVVDVRTGPEYRWFHIPGAIHRPDLLTRPEALEGEDDDREVVVICMTGHRSSPVAFRLKRRGFSRVRHLTGGMVGWALAGGPTRTGKAPG